MIVVLGASGFIGNYFFNRLKEEGLDVIGTFFKNKKAGLLYFDLKNMRFDELGLDKKRIEYMIITAATNATIDDSKINWDDSYNVNVIKTRALMDYCFENNIIPVYISTDNVFDGKKGGYKEADSRNPINCYGRIRYEVENHLLDSDRSFIILRMGKVFGTELGDGTLITDMVKALKEGKRLLCADDQIFTPLYIEDLFNAIRFLIDNGHRGVFHLASTKPTTRYEMAKAIQRYFNLKDAEIAPCRINSLGLLEERPLLIDLDDTKFRDITGAEPKGITDYIGMVA